jgi:hypothetical protein
LKFGVIVESMSFTEKPARKSGVATARIPRGAVASELAKEGKKKTTFLDIDFVPGPQPHLTGGNVSICHVDVRACHISVISPSRAISSLDFALQ